MASGSSGWRTRHSPTAFGALRPRRAAVDAETETWRAARSSVVTSEALVGPAVERAADDLLSLRAWELEPSDDGSAWVVNAGVPKFTGFFGRDTLTAGWQAAMLGPEPLRGALEIAARTQGTRSDPWTEEEPGRMVHEMRRGPLSMLGVRPHRAYYGSQTTGSMFLLGLSASCGIGPVTTSCSGAIATLRSARSSGPRPTAMPTGTASWNIGGSRPMA